MATADSVVLALQAKDDGFTATVNRAAQTTDAAMSKVEKAAGEAEASVQRSMNGLGSSVGKAANDIETGSRRVANGTRNLGRQVADVGVGLTSGQSPFLILAQQAPQVADALADTGGKAAKVAAFFASPWGAAMLAAGSAAGILLGKILESDDALGKETEKLKDNAEKTRIGEQAKALFGRTLEGVTVALNENQKALDAEGASARTAAEKTEQLAAAQLKVLAALRATAAARLADAEANAQAQQQRSAGPGQRGELATLGVQGADNAVQIARDALAKTDVAIAKAQKQVEVSQAQEVVDYSRLSTADKINRQYDAQIKKAQTLAVANHSVATELRAQVDAINAARDAKLKADAESKKGGRTGENSSFILPVNGTITSGFGPRKAPTAGASTFHPGIDIAAPIGTPVKAAAGGVVISSGRLGGLGNVVIVDHGGGTITEYGHLSRLVASKGQKVAQGDVIGEVGNTGISTGPHLDYRVKVNGKAVDPRKGRFATDEVSAGLKANALAETAAREAEAARQKAITRQKAYDSEVESLNAANLNAQRKNVVDVAELARLASDQVTAETAKKTIAYTAAQKAGDLTEAQADLLRAKAKEVDKAKKAGIEADKEAALTAQRVNLLSNDLRNQEGILELTASLAETSDVRNGIEKQILDLKYQEARLLQEENLKAATKANDKYGVDLAKQNIADLDKRKPLEDAALAQRQRGSYETYRKGIAGDFTTLQETVDNIKVDALRSLEDTLVNSAKAALGLSGALGDVVAQIIRIGIERKIIGPLADALFGKADGSSSGGFGGLLTSVIGAFGGGKSSAAVAASKFSLPGFGKRAMGGPVSAGGAYLVGERGPEILQMGSAAGNVIPNHELNARPAAASTKVFNINVDSRNSVTPAGFAQSLSREILAQASNMDQQTAGATLRAAPAAVARAQRYGG